MSGTSHGYEKEVWEMQGITGNDKFVLLAFSKYADHHGYCYPGEERVADDCGLSLRTVQRAKANLTRMKLLKSVRRRDRRTGDPISNITRLNTELIRSMRRPPKHYDDNLIGDFIVFEEPDNTGHSVPSDCQVGGSDQNGMKGESGHSVPSDCQVVPVNLTGPSRQIGGQSSSSERPANSSSLIGSRLTPRPGRGAKARRTEETKIKDFSHTHLKAAEALVCGLPGSITGTDRKVLVRLVCAAFDGGWSPSGLAEHLRANCDLERVKFPGRVYVKHAGQDLPPAGGDEPARARRELCQVCDEQGFTGEVSACSKDPQAVPGMCLHGQPDPWDDETYRAERETERAEALYALQRAQEEARDRKTRMERAKAQEAARRAEAKARRRREAAEFLATADSLGDEVADEVRRALLEADDPAALEDLDNLVDAGIGFVESGGSVPELRVVLARTERENWRTVLLDRSTVAA